MLDYSVYILWRFSESAFVIIILITNERDADSMAVGLAVMHFFGRRIMMQETPDNWIQT